MKSIFCLLFSLTTMTAIYSQVGIGLTAGTDTYQRYSNGDDIEYASAGSFLLNLTMGPKLWIGGDKFSVSAEAQANIGLLGLAIKDYNGLGMASFPMIGRLNFLGLSGMDKELKPGFSIGGGIQFNKTELYYLSNDFEAKGGERNFFKTYIVELGAGLGMSGVSGFVFARYGFNPDSSANSFNIGVLMDFNIRKISTIFDPNSEL